MIRGKLFPREKYQSKSESGSKLTPKTRALIFRMEKLERVLEAARAVVSQNPYMFTHKELYDAVKAVENE